MPADRLLHPKCGKSRKVSMLTDLEFRVWIQYLLCADDFGVMHATAVELQSKNLHLVNRPARVLLRCLDALVTCGLLHRFEHQGQPYVFSTNWQTFQKVEYPRATDNPTLPDDALAACDAATRELMTKYPGGQRKDRRRANNEPEDSARASLARPEHLERASQTDPEDDPTTRARGRAERLTANGIRLPANGEGERTDLAFESFQKAYPRARVKGGYTVQTAFFDQVAKAGGAMALMDALDNHKASEQWADPKLIPGMDTWLREERWRQRLEPKGSAVNGKPLPAWAQKARGAQV